MRLLSVGSVITTVLDVLLAVYNDMPWYSSISVKKKKNHARQQHENVLDSR